MMLFLATISLLRWMGRTNNRVKFWRFFTNDTFMFVVLSETSSVTNINTDLPIVLNVDGAVIHSYQKEALWVWSEQQCEWRVSADVLSEEQRAGGREFIQVAVERHYKLICHQQSLVLWRETEWERHPGYVLSTQISWFQHEILQNNWILRYRHPSKTSSWSYV